MSLDGCQAIIGGRDTGKTTFLLRLAERAIAEGIPVMVIDSATDHTEKSLLYKLRNVYAHTWFPSPSVAKIVEMPTSGGLDQVYPFSEMLCLPSGPAGKLLLVDVAYYLELGYETESLPLREERRKLYRLFAAQAAWSFGAYIQGKSSALLLLDEIELTDSYWHLLPKLSRAGCGVWAALHQCAGLAPCEEMFFCGTLQDYELCPLDGGQHVS